MKRISVVIPVFNCAAYLEQTIASILNQGADDLEVLIIDDGSTDQSVSIARAFGEPVKVFEQANAGVCVARNRGLAQASGEFVAFVDHDDFWLPNKLFAQLSAFDQHPEIDVVFSDFIRWNRDDGTGEFPPPATFPIRAAEDGIDPDYSGWIYHQMLLDSHVLTSTALARTRIIREAGGFDESLPFSEDWDLWLRISRRSQFLKLRQATTLYRQHPTQGSRMTRAVDYRTRLLKNAYRQWGLCSPDGRCIDKKRFRRQLAAYSVSFGLNHLRGEAGASRYIAAKSFVDALMIDWRYWRGLAYLAVTPLGWKPNW